jgi:hypothetical protein
MLQTVDLGRSSLAAYRGLAPDGILDDLELADPAHFVPSLAVASGTAP